MVGVHASTVSRELRRNKSQTGYYAQAAHRHAQQRRLQSRGPTKWTRRSQRLVESKLRQQWNPEQIADWEADLMLGGQGGGALLTIVERKSRWTSMARLPSKQSEVVAEALINLLRPYKKQVATVTVDNGNEFAQHVNVSKAFQVAVYFAHPYCAWQRGLSKVPTAYCDSIFPRAPT